MDGISGQLEYAAAQDQARPKSSHENRTGLRIRRRSVLLESQAERHSCRGRAQVAEVLAHHREAIERQAALAGKHFEQPGIGLMGGKAARAIQAAAGSRFQLAQQRVELAYRGSSQRVAIEFEL